MRPVALISRVNTAVRPGTRSLAVAAKPFPGQRVPPHPAHFTRKLPTTVRVPPPPPNAPLIESLNWTLVLATVVSISAVTYGTVKLFQGFILPSLFPDATPALGETSAPAAVPVSPQAVEAVAANTVQQAPAISATPVNTVQEAPTAPTLPAPTAAPVLAPATPEPAAAAVEADVKAAAPKQSWAKSWVSSTSGGSKSSSSAQ